MKSKTQKFEKFFDKLFIVYYIVFGVLLAVTMTNLVMDSVLFKLNENVVGGLFAVGIFAPVFAYGIGYYILTKKESKLENA